VNKREQCTTAKQAECDGALPLRARYDVSWRRIPVRDAGLVCVPLESHGTRLNGQLEHKLAFHAPHGDAQKRGDDIAAFAKLIIIIENCHILRPESIPEICYAALERPIG
jgi:hypothetical protein